MWMTVREYAIKANVTPKIIYKKIKANQIQSKKVKGILQVYDDSAFKQETESKNIETESEWQKQQAENKRLDNELKAQKLKNLKQDTLLKKQKNDFIKQKYRLEYAEGVLMCFAESFSDLKNFLIKLKMSQQEKESFQLQFSNCMKKFRKQLKKYLTEKDIDNEEVIAE